MKHQTYPRYIAKIKLSSRKAAVVLAEKLQGSVLENTVLIPCATKATALYYIDKYGK